MTAAEAERLRAEEERREVQLAESARRREAALWHPMANAVHAARAAAYGLLDAGPAGPMEAGPWPTGRAGFVVRLAKWRTAAAALSVTADDYARAVTQASRATTANLARTGH